MKNHNPLICIYLIIASTLAVACKDRAPTHDEPSKLSPLKPKHPMDHRRVDCEDTDIAACVQRCESDHPDALLYCENAWRLFYGEDEQEMRRLLTLSCEKGSSLDCLYLAKLFVIAAHNPHIPSDCTIPLEYHKQYINIMKKYYPLVRSRCDEGRDPVSCSIISTYYHASSNSWTGWPLNYGSICTDIPPIEPYEILFLPDREIALEYRKNACMDGGLGWELCYARALAKENHDEAVRNLTWECENGDPDSRKAICKELEELKNQR
jgi:hypothetical protein